MPKAPQNLSELSALVQMVSDLRGPDGCAWDKQQTTQTLIPYLIEETFEVVDALEKNDESEKCEELGDLLFQIVIHAQLASEKKSFKMQDVITSINEKIVRRHPHVFADSKVNGIDDILLNWERIKSEEKKLKPKTALSPFRKSLIFPALIAADKIGYKAKDLKFDWSTAHEVLEKVDEELNELKAEIKLTPDENKKNQKRLKEELGDLLFSVVQLARHLDLDPEECLRSTNNKFTSRFSHMLHNCDDNVEVFKNLSDEDKQLLWKKAKLSE